MTSLALLLLYLICGFIVLCTWLRSDETESSQDVKIMLTLICLLRWPAIVALFSGYAFLTSVLSLAEKINKKGGRNGRS